MTQDIATIEREECGNGAVAGWTLTYAGQSCRCDDLPGVRHLAFLLARPGVAVSALMLEENAGRSVDPCARVQLHDSRERARVCVASEIGEALERIAAEHPVLARHLRAHVQVDVLCVYDPGVQQRSQAGSRGASQPTAGRPARAPASPRGTVMFAALGGR